MSDLDSASDGRTNLADGMRVTYAVPTPWPATVPGRLKSGGMSAALKRADDRHTIHTPELGPS